ncbi:MAG: hypothetical protein KUG77_19610 [Nannocystaceae bacterium]|nr:hypothetical protein [Nannocystaceae bacterium]
MQALIRVSPRWARGFTWWCFAAAVLMSLGTPTTAHASDGYGVVTLDLRPEGADVPTHLCVVSEGKGARTRKTLRELLEPQADSPRAGTAGTSWRVKPSVWSADADDTAVDALRCSEDASADCRPRIEPPSGLSGQDELHVACTADSLTQGGESAEPRPLFVLLEFLEGSPPKIESVRLAGGIATIGVMSPPFDRVIVTARSLGGYYRSHGRSERGRAEGPSTDPDGSSRATTVRLAVTPRCRMVEVRLPRTRVKATDRDRLGVRINGIDYVPGRCVGNLVGSEVIQVRMPPAPLRVGGVDVQLDAIEGGSGGARFGGSFEGEWPKSPMSLDFNLVTFTWRRPACIYPRDACPDATLETGTTCAATITNTGCAYSCPGEFITEQALALDLPLQVTFEKDDPNQSWTDTLAQSGQELTSYVPADEVYLAANINQWETGIPDNQINSIVLFGEDGAEREYGVTHLDRLLLKVPGAGLQGRGGTCESVRFKPRGDRAYDELVASVEEGELVLGRPERGARRVSFNLSLLFGGGPAWSGNLETPPIYFSGLAMFAVRVQPRRRGWNRVGFEIRSGGTLGRWGVPVVEDTDDELAPPMRKLEGNDDASSEESGEARIGWARVLVEPGIVVSLQERIALGGGFGMGFSLPYRGADDITGATLNFIVSPNLDLRFRLRRWLRLVVQFRGVFGEKEFERPAEDEGNRPKPGDRAQSLLVLGGLQAQF